MCRLIFSKFHLGSPGPNYAYVFYPLFPRSGPSVLKKMLIYEKTYPLNFEVKIKVVEKVKLYRKSWISALSILWESSYDFCWKYWFLVNHIFLRGLIIFRIFRISRFSRIFRIFRIFRIGRIGRNLSNSQFNPIWMSWTSWKVWAEPCAAHAA